MKQLQQKYTALLAVHCDSGVQLDTNADPCYSVIYYLHWVFSVISYGGWGGGSEHLMTAQALRDTVKENEAFFYNPVIMPTMTSPNNNQPHNQKNVTQSHKNSRGLL